jgi:predicted CXXCH cytochrome family protein
MRFMLQSLSVLVKTFIVLIVFCTHAFAATTTAPLQPDSAKECAICHYSWVDTFFIEKLNTALATFPENPTVADSDMCYSCHDGSTVDSRKHVYNDRKHQTGVIPSDKIKVPDIFPLDEEGKMDCATCHSAHGVATEPGIEKTIFLRISHENSEMCKMCHVDKEGGAEKGNHPIDKTTLKISQDILKYGGYTGNEPNQVICESCHVAHGGFTDKRLVLPVDQPSTYPVLCEACHGKTPGRNEERGRNRFSHSVDLKPENAEIPDRWKNGQEVRRGSRGELVCVTCHSTHTPSVNESLLTEKNEKDSLCLQCHASQEKLIKDTKHDLSLMAPDEKNVQGQKVSQSGPCSSCHLTHEGVGPFMWARTWEGEEENLVGICASCHVKGRCAEESPVPETGHPVGVKPEKIEVALDFPLFTETGKKNSKGILYCSSCHNTHQWDPRNPDNKGSSEVKGDITNSFLRASHQDSLLCLGCHKEEAAIEKTDHDLSLSAPEEKNILGQTSSESGICGSCHLAHGGADAFMWSRKLGEGEETAMDELCLECHREGKCGEEKQIGVHFHPLEVKVKNGQDITLPLFSPEGKKDPQGVVSCASCHNPHQWDPGNPDKKGEEGTPADSFLRVTSAGSSPLCTGCHPETRYIEGTDHDFRVTAPQEKNKQGLLPEESGLCGQCHAAHNAVIAPFIWNRNLGPSTVSGWKEEFSTKENIMISLCTGCHMAGECAGEQMPDYALHPGRLYIAMMQEKLDLVAANQFEAFMDQFPVFSSTGEKSVEGNIVCSTCHDDHLFDPYHLQKGPGVEVEGNATNSFLRKNISFTFCASCHGEDALYKFKYFHKAKGRVEGQ